MNKFVLAGRVGQTPLLRFTPTTNTPVTTLRIATKELKNNEQVTVWHNITVWSSQAEICCKHLEKGSSVIIEGIIQYKNHPSAGDTIIFPIAELVAQRVEFI